MSALTNSRTRRAKTHARDEWRSGLACMTPLERLRRFFFIRFLLEDPRKCVHEWWVYSTAIREVSLEVHCSRCALLGAIENPTKEEWSRASGAPSEPYFVDRCVESPSGHSSVHMRVRMSPNNRLQATCETHAPEARR